MKLADWAAKPEECSGGVVRWLICLWVGGGWRWKTSPILAPVDASIHRARMKDHREIRTSEGYVGTAVGTTQLTATVSLSSVQSFGTLALDVPQTSIAHCKTSKGVTHMLIHTATTTVNRMTN